MDYDDSHSYNRLLVRPRPAMPSRDIYSSELEGLDAKVVIMGNSAVGKTSLLKRFTENKFTPEVTTSTTGAFFVTKKLFVDGLKVRLQLWDTAGQERFRSMAPMYYRGANAAILCYDITDSSSFDDIRIWLEELKYNQHPASLGRENEDESLLIYIVGAKLDMAKTKRAISLEQARRTLHVWFPPPERRPPTPPPRPSGVSNITTASGFSYIRPRFTSLTTSLSVPQRPVPDPSPPNRDGLTRAKSARQVPVGIPLNGASDWKSRPPGVRERRWSDAMMWDEAMREENAGDDADAQNRETITDSTSDPGDEDPDEAWPLEKGMELFEVSAKDGQGVQVLFEHLIGNIIRRRHAIQRERALRERDSVMLNASVPAWSTSTDTEDGKGGSAITTSKVNGWSCCST